MNGGQSSTPAGGTSQTQNTDQGVGGGQQQQQQQQQPAAKWFEALPEAMRQDHSVTKYDSLEKMVEGHQHALKRLGTPAERLLALPEKMDEPGALDEIFGKLGRPDAPEGYQLTLADNASDADRQFVEGFRAVAHKAGLSQGQMVAAVGYLNEVTGQAMQAQQAADEAASRQCRAELDKAWGGKAKVYDAEIPRLLGELDTKLNLGGGLVDELNANGLANSPKLLQVLAAITDMRAEPGVLPGAGNGGGGDGRGMTPAEAQSTLNARNADGEWMKALRDRNHPRHAEVLAERQRLLGFVNPPKAA